MNGKGHTYKAAGVDVRNAERTKDQMGVLMETKDTRVLNRPGAFASLFLPRFEGVENPVLVLKAEEPGSKQWLALEHRRIPTICQDLIHHLINDIVVMGAKPEVVLDTILCGQMEKETVVSIVKHLAMACQEQNCSLIGGETSEQPGLLEKGRYMLNASILGVVDRDRIVDGSRIRPGDRILALASNGLHTNGYSLVRKLMAERPEIMKETIDGLSFLDAILLPHTCYYKPLLLIQGKPYLHGMAHITGGGIEGNLKRILPEGTSASIDLSHIRVHPLFPVIRHYGQVPEEDMLQTFNMGVGLVVVVDREHEADVLEQLAAEGCPTYTIGEIVEGARNITFHNYLTW
ncbi:phosphoribosylformylglycinamidine cyclo-ligase [Paenibacillus koleovorans]|uniref:phosphoribosylformylglycinamidine cyclo-ligase n=1 Tax=Paenibacillus koleovorans TaxID=121608 RepID=UPI000FDA98A4|nr:phosphoribosylformylglycinamidine cyclo-ligase [Paenibacillus koleovorans]